MIFESSMRNSQWREQNGNIITIFIDLALSELETAILDTSFHDSDIRFVISDPKNPCIRSNTRFEHIFMGRKIIVRHLESAILDSEFHKSDIRFVISDPKNPCIRSNTRFELIDRKIIVRHLESAILDTEFHKSDIRFVISDPKNPCIPIFSK